MTITGTDLIDLGVRPGPTLGAGLRSAQEIAARDGRAAALAAVARVVADPAAHTADPELGAFARALAAAHRREGSAVWHERAVPAPYASWCGELEGGALAQMTSAMRLPSAVRGALMPDAHQGYGLPIGGVLATEGTVIPYAVGVDIACRMKLTVLDLAPAAIDDQPERLERALLHETSFGMGARLSERADHPVLDADRWRITPPIRALRDRAAAQLGSSGSGNHFVEFGILTLPADDLGLAAGRYLALLSHSGSRGAGANIAGTYSKLAKKEHRELPSQLANLAWLDLADEAGQEYWQAMELMGAYAAANHEIIHARVARHLGAAVLAGVENHHNYAWREEVDGRELIVHRKGATPAHAGVLGVIPGSMATPGFVVRGRGVADSLGSASHGAGRAMSRTAARRRYRWDDVRPLLERAGVRLLAAGIDESPQAYKDIEQVMAAQRDLVDVVARFDPRIVRMADGGEPAED